MSSSKDFIKIKLNTLGVRTLPHPFAKDIQEIYCYVQAKSLKEIDIPNDPNPRDPITDKKSFDELSEIVAQADTHPDMFGYAAIGLHIYASEAELDNKTGELTLSLSKSKTTRDGLVNGNHLLKAIQDADEVPEDRFVRAFIMTKVPELKKLDISVGLNSSNEVSKESIWNYQGKLDWIKKSIKNTEWEDLVVYHQGDTGNFPVRDILTTLYTLRIDGTEMKFTPEINTVGYGRKHTVMSIYDIDENIKLFSARDKDLAKILKFQDYMQFTAEKLWKEAGGDEDTYMFKTYSATKCPSNPTEGKPDRMLQNGVLVPLLAAFRALIAYDGKFDYHKAKTIWDSIGAELMLEPHMTANNYGELRPVGYDTTFWMNSFMKVLKEAKMQYPKYKRKSA